MQSRLRLLGLRPHSFRFAFELPLMEDLTVVVEVLLVLDVSSLALRAEFALPIFEMLVYQLLGQHFSDVHR